MEGISEILKKKYSMGAAPVYTFRHCLNSVPGGPRCNLCNSLCPENISITTQSSRNRTEICISCGICSGVCPTGAVSPTNASVKAFLMAVGRSGELSVGCGRDEDDWNLALPCLAALSWEQICIAALTNGIVLSLRKCDNCPNPGHVEQVKQNLQKARKFLGDELYFDKVTVLREGDEYEPTGENLSRRELFNVFRAFPLDVAFSMLPEMSEKDSPGLFYRAILRDKVRELYESSKEGNRTKFVVTLPKVEDSCFGCGICVGKCPEKALKIIKSADGEKFSVAVEVWKCTGCGACKAACREKSISAMASMAVPHLGKVLIKRLPVSNCKECGAPCHRGGQQLCPLCEAKARNEARRQKSQ